MNFFNKFSLLVILSLGMFFTSCQQENIEEIVVTETPVVSPETTTVNNLISASVANTDEGVELACLTINFPVDMVLQSGNTITISTQEEFEDASVQEGENAIVDFVFPLTVTDEEGNETVVEDNLDLGEAFLSCIPDSGWTPTDDETASIPAFLLDGSCIELIYPLALTDAEGNNYTANNEAELIDLCATVESVFFSLPMTVLDSEGNEVEIENMEVFFNLVTECEGISPPVVGDDVTITGFGCNELLYPINVALEDGTVVTLNNADEYVNLLLEGTAMELVYPFSIENIDGETVVVNSFEEFIPLLVACGVGIDITPSETCDTPAHALLFFNQGTGTTGCGYTINFPLQLEAEGTVYDINEFDDYFPVYNAYQFQINLINVVYPTSVTLTDGTTLTFEADEDICALIDEC